MPVSTAIRGHTFPAPMLGKLAFRARPGHPRRTFPDSLGWRVRDTIPTSTPTRFRRRWRAGCGALVMITHALSAAAESYPSHPIKLIVPYPAGTSTDLLARQVAPKTAELLGQPI